MDERDDSLVRLYRRSSREEPPAQLDLAVLEMARRAPRRSVRVPFGNHWLAAAGAVVAVALTSVLLVAILREPGGVTSPPAATPGAGPVQVPGAQTVKLPLPPPRARQTREADAAGSRPADAERARPERQADAGPTPPSGGPSAEQPHAAAGPPQPRFDFYKTLPEMQVAVPPQLPAGTADAVTIPQAAPVTKSVPVPVPESAHAPEAVPAPVPAEAGTVPPPATAPGAGRATGPVPAAAAAGYYLQVGAFRGADAATRFKGRIEALGLPASIEDITLDNQETWHRVRIGPYHDTTVMEDVQARLKAQGIDSMRVRIDEH